MGSRDHSEFGAFARRILRAMGRRCAAADVEDLADLLALRAEVDTAVDAAVAGLREQGHSWTEIGRVTGVTRQAARQRWSDKVALSVESRAADSRS